MLHRFKVVLLVLCLVALGAATAAASSVTFTQVPVVPNTGGVYGTSLYTGWNINASGQTTGYCTLKTSSSDPGKANAWASSGGSTTAIMRPNGIDGNGNDYNNQSYGYGINSAGTVVGYCNSTALSAGAQAFVMSGGSMTVFDTGWETGQSRAYNINSSGTIIGAGQVSGTFHPMIYSYSGTYSGGVYSGGSWSYTDLDNVLGGSNGAGYGLGINDAGTVTGYAPSASNSSYYHAFVRTSTGAVTDLGVQSGYNYSLGEGINANGDVIGYNYGPGFLYNAFLATAASGYTMTPLASPSTVDDTLAYQVNDYDMAVGIGYLTASSNTSYDALLWTTGNVPGLPAGVIDLNTLNTYFPGTIPSGWVLTTARGINDAGQIVGTATYGGSQYAYELTVPVPTATPEPSTLLLAAMGLVGLAAYAWRKRK